MFYYNTICHFFLPRLLSVLVFYCDFLCYFLFISLCMSVFSFGTLDGKTFCVYFYVFISLINSLIIGTHSYVTVFNKNIACQVEIPL